MPITTAPPRQRHRRLAGAAAELEHPLALQVAEQAEVALGRPVGSVGQRVVGVHARIIAPGAAVSS